MRGGKMTNIDLNTISQIILNGIFDQELDKQIRIDILDNIPDKHYEVACAVFNATRQVYFDFGFIDNSYTKDKDAQAKTSVLDNVHYTHHDVACTVFEATRKAYFDLGFELRRSLI